MRTLLFFIIAVAGAIAILHLSRDYLTAICWIIFWTMATGRSKDNA